MKIIPLLVVLSVANVCSAHYKNCGWVPTSYCGGGLFGCIGRIKLGLNALTSEEAKNVERDVLNELKPWGMNIIGAIKNFTGECSIDPNQSRSVQGQELCCDITVADSSTL